MSNSTASSNETLAQRWLTRAPVLYAICLLLSLLLYAPTLKAFLIYDDVAIIPSVSAPGSKGWLGAVSPVSNGFNRPATLLLFKICYILVGTKPFLYHLFALMIHAGVATLTGLVAARLLPNVRYAALLAALMMTTHYGAFGGASMLSNSCDTIAALGILFAVLHWDRWLHAPAKRSLILVIAGMFIAIAGKELAVVTPAVLLLWAQGRHRLNQQSLRVVVWLGVFAGAYLAAALWMQVIAKISYVNLGHVAAGEGGALPRFLNLVSNSYMPYLSVVDWPVGKVDTSSEVLRFARRVAAVLLLVCFSTLARKSRFRMAAAMVLCAAVLVLPVAPINTVLHPRYVYSALPFTIFAFLSVATVVSTRTRLVFIVLLAQLWSLHLWSARWSPTTQRYLRTARTWEKFVKLVDKERVNWPPMSVVTVISNWQHHGRKYISAPYGQAILTVFYPNLLVKYVSNKVLPETTHRYRFDGHNLIVVNDEPTTPSEAN